MSSCAKSKGSRDTQSHLNNRSDVLQEDAIRVSPAHSHNFVPSSRLARQITKTSLRRRILHLEPPSWHNRFSWFLRRMTFELPQFNM